MDLQQVVVTSRYIMILVNSAAISLFSLLNLTLQKTTKPWFSFSASSTAMYFFIYPPFSRRFRRSNTGVDERLTLAASSFVVSRAFDCRVRRICKSTLSNFSSVFIRIKFYQNPFFDPDTVYAFC